MADSFFDTKFARLLQIKVRVDPTGISVTTAWEAMTLLCSVALLASSNVHDRFFNTLCLYHRCECKGWTSKLSAPTPTPTPNMHTGTYM